MFIFSVSRRTAWNYTIDAKLILLWNSEQRLCHDIDIADARSL